MFYLELFATLARHRVAYVVIGGLAVALHGIERATMDIDISIALDTKNLEALRNAANELGMSPVLPVPLSTLLDLETLRTWHTERNLEAFALRAPGLAGVTLDILLFPPVAFEQLNERALHRLVAGTRVNLISIPDLIALKEAVGRPIDQADVAHLRRLMQP